MKSFLLILFFPYLLNAQHQERKVLLYNLGFGGVTSGIGAVINKKHNENWKKAFFRGLWQGSIGGLVNYSSKKVIGVLDDNENFGYAIPARLVNAAGNSIIQNAAANEPFLENWNFEYGFLRLDFSTRKRSKLKVRILPVAIASSIVALQKGKLDLNTTLMTGVMTFRAKDSINYGRKNYDGMNYGRAIVYYDSTTRFFVLSHEIIHEYQYREYLVFNSWLKQSASKIKSPWVKKTFTKYIYADIPYFGAAYMLEGMEPFPYFYRNYFEFEAQRIVTNRVVSFE